MGIISKRLLTVGCIALLCCPAPALAKGPKTHAPPGNSGVDEYLEVVPDGGGNRPAGGLKGGGSGHGLSQKQRSALRSYGRDGRAVSRLAQQTAPQRKRGDARSGALGTQAADSPDTGVIAALKRTFSALGGGFILFFVVILAGGLVLGLRRRQRSSA
jgi:hypothetical protein